MSRLARPKTYFTRTDLFKRFEDLDYKMNGKSYMGFIFRDVLPVTACVDKDSFGKGWVFDRARIDYLGISYAFARMRGIGKIVDEFYGCPIDKFDIDKMIENCDAIIANFDINKPYESIRVKQVEEAANRAFK